MTRGYSGGRSYSGDHGGRGRGSYRGGWYGGGRHVSFGLGWYDPWYYWADYSPAYYDYEYYGDLYDGYDPYAYDPYGYYSTPAPAAVVVAGSRVRPAYGRGPVRSAYAPARVVVVGDGRWHRFGER